MKSGLPQFLTFSSAGAGSARRNSQRHRARFSCGQSPSVEPSWHVSGSEQRGGGPLYIHSGLYIELWAVYDTGSYETLHNM